MNSGVGGAGMIMGLLFLAALIFLVVLFVAPIKLYSIHREIRYTNDLLKQQTDLLTAILAEARYTNDLLKPQTDLLTRIEDRNRVEVGLLATMSHMSKEVRERITS